MSFYDAIRVGASGAADFEVERSLRFNKSDAPKLQRTLSSNGNRKTFTWSGWVKKSELIYGQLFSSTTELGSGNSHTYLAFNASLQLVAQSYDYSGGGTNYNLITTQVFRDPSAWYHVVWAVDTTQSTSSNRVKLYLNGEQITSFSTEAYPSQNYEGLINNSSYKMLMGNAFPSLSNNSPLDGYLAEATFIDGLQLTPASFGETNAATGQWVPIDTSGLTFGTNGFRLNFSDNSGTTATTLGKDSSGNGNNFTPNNYATTDAVKDTPTNNFCVLNINDNNLSESSPHFVYSEGNLKAAWSFSGTNFDRAYGTLFVEGNDTNKYYWEATGTQNNEQMQWGVHGTHISAYQANNRNTNSTASADMAVLMWQPYGSAPYLYGYDASSGSYGDLLSTSNGNPANGDIFGFVFDGATGKFYVWFKGVELSGQNYAAGTSLFDAVDSTKTYALHNSQGDGGTSTKNGNFVMNWGQDSSFAGAKTPQGNTDANGIGDFYYSVPSGAKALCSKNLPDPLIKKGNKHFNTLIWTGNSTNNRAITGLDFQPDFVWIKKRTSSASQHSLVDSLHETTDNGSGNGNVGDLDSSSNRAPAAQSAGGFESFDANGFTLGKGSNDANADSAYQLNNASGQTYVAWNWNFGDTDGKTYTVTVVSDSGNKYRFDGFGTSAVTLDLAEGGTYIFNYPSAHPFRFSTTADGTHGGGSEYTTGVTVLSSTSVQIVVAASAPQLYYFCTLHSGMGGAINTNSTLGSSNFDGTIQTTVKVNSTAGMSAIRYTGTGSDGTLGHGLGVAPSIYIVKRRNSAKDWYVQIGNLTGIDLGRFLKLNSNTGISFASDVFAATADTSSVLNTKSDSATNGSNDTYIIYCFSNVEGYSKAGVYTGNGITKGTFVYTGFRPSFILFRNISSTTQWEIYDTTRPYGLYNPAFRPLYANHNYVEETHSSLPALDILSNGFKPRGTWDEFNQNGSTIFYLAFSESPFKNARAR